MRNQFAHIGKAAIVGERAGYVCSRKPGEVLNDADLQAMFKRFELDCGAAQCISH